MLCWVRRPSWRRIFFARSRRPSKGLLRRVFSLLGSRIIANRPIGAFPRFQAEFAPASGQTGVADFPWSRIICIVTKTTAGVRFRGRIVEGAATRRRRWRIDLDGANSSPNQVPPQAVPAGPPCHNKKDRPAAVLKALTQKRFFLSGKRLVRPPFPSRTKETYQPQAARKEWKRCGKRRRPRWILVSGTENAGCPRVACERAAISSVAVAEANMHTEIVALIVKYEVA